MRAPRRSFGGKKMINPQLSLQYIDHQKNISINILGWYILNLDISCFLAGYYYHVCFFDLRFCEDIQMLMMSKLSGRYLLIFLCLLVQQMVDRPTDSKIKHQFRKATTNLQLIFSRIPSSTVGVPIKKT